MAKNGLEPSIAFAYAAMALEMVGGVCLILGLFTRFFAAALAIEMLIALIAVHLRRAMRRAAGGYEYVLLIGVVCFAIAMRGGGPYSVDRRSAKNSDNPAREAALDRRLAYPHLVVVEGGAAVGRDRIRAGQRVDAAAVGVSRIRPDRFRDQHAAPHAVEQLARAGAPAPRVLPSTT